MSRFTARYQAPARTDTIPAKISNADTSRRLPKLSFSTKLAMIPTKRTLLSRKAETNPMGAL
ncbi:MAG TPA: hypothetical protein VLJ57_15955, partial [Burkholderiaceae bacterium]|nr:hypothetical protein [Burkholderiaceae bacterium]